MRTWILLSALLICMAIAPDQEIPISIAVIVSIAFIGGLVMDLIEFFTRNKEN